MAQSYLVNYCYHHFIFQSLENMYIADIPAEKVGTIAGTTYPGVNFADPGSATASRYPRVMLMLYFTQTRRYAEWMAEAERRYDEEWNERLESESVQSLSRSFYKSFAKGHYSGDCGETACTDGFSYSSSMESLTLGRSSSHVTCHTALSCDRSEEDGSVTARHGVLEASQLKDAEGRAPSPVVSSRTLLVPGQDTPEHVRPQPPVDSSSSAAKEKPARRSIFDLTRAFQSLRACSSARTVLPVRLGRALPQSSVVIPPAVIKTPIAPPKCIARRRRVRSRCGSLEQSGEVDMTRRNHAAPPAVDDGTTLEKPPAGCATPCE